MSGTGEVVTFTEAAVDLAKLRLVAQTLIAVAFTPSTAHLLALCLPAGTQVYTAGFALLALAPGTQVSRLTVTGPTIIST